MKEIKLNNKQRPKESEPTSNRVNRYERISIKKDRLFSQSVYKHTVRMLFMRLELIYFYYVIYFCSEDAVLSSPTQKYFLKRLCCSYLSH